MSFLDAMLHQLLSNNLWAPVLFWMVLLFWWHLCTKFSSAKRTPLYNYINAGTSTKSKLQPCPRTFSLSSLPLYFPSVFASPSSWQNAFLPTATLVLRYVLNQANRQRFLPGLRPENLPVLRYWGVTLLRLFKFLKSSKRSLNNQSKRRTLRLESSYWWPTHRDGAVQINDHYSCDTSWV